MKGYNELCFFSDNCGGQNRNRFLYSMWEYASFTMKVKITHTFLGRGHTQSEGDSMHSCVEHAKKGKSIYVPAQWITLVRSGTYSGGVDPPHYLTNRCNLVRSCVYII